jgi:triosephosphate isomerase (TIM)
LLDKILLKEEGLPKFLEDFLIMIARKPLLVANWKMNKTSAQSADFCRELAMRMGKDIPRVQVVICPPFTALQNTGKALDGSAIALGAQNMNPARSGAFTGEISGEMLRDLFVTFVILGHSERRRLFGETDAFIREKLIAANEQRLKAILCIGETLEERESGQTKAVIESQIKNALLEIPAEQCSTLTIAYEPVWAIGTGKAATPEMAEEAHAYIREVLVSYSGKDLAQRMRIIYGGSVNPENAASLFAKPNIDGALVGNAALDIRAFEKLIILLEKS